MKFKSSLLVLVGIIGGFAITASINCTTPQIQQAQSAVTAGQTAVAAESAALAQAQAVATTQPSAQTTQTIATLTTLNQQAQTALAAAQATVTALQAAQNAGTSGQIAAGASAIGGFLPPPYNAIALTIGVIAAAVAGYQTQQKNKAQSDLADANASLQQHQVVLAAVSGSTTPITTTTTLSHPALVAPVVAPAVTPKP